MNIGLFTDCYLPTRNGVVTSLRHLKSGLEQHGHQVIVVTVKTPGSPIQDPEVYQLPSVSFRRDLDLRLGLVTPQMVNTIADQAHLDIIHVHSEFSLGWAAKRAARKLGIPLLYTAHTLYEYYRHYLPLGSSRLVSSAMLHAFQKHFINGFDLLIAPSPKMECYLAALGLPVPIVTIPNGIDIRRFSAVHSSPDSQYQLRQQLGIQANDRIVLFVGRLEQEKRVSELLSAFAPFLHNQTELKLVMVGEGSLKPSLQALAFELNIREKIIFPGSVDWQDIHHFYAMADVFVTASLSEVHPVSVIEGLASGLPVVTRRDPGYLGLVEDGWNGYLVNTDPEVAVRVLDLLNNEKQCQAFGHRSKAKAAQFTVENHISKIKAAYQQLTASGAMV